MTAPLAAGLCYLATLNVASLACHMAETLASAQRLQLSLLCLQETRVHPDSWDAVRRAFSAQRWQTHFVERSATGAGGMLIASRLPSARFELPSNPLYDGRAMAVQVYRQGARPILLANFHGHASDPYTASRAAQALLTVLGSSGDPWILCGDHNLLASQWPYTPALASGRARSWDDLYPLGTIQGTRRHRGTHTGRTIDFAIASPEVHCHGRHQEIGPGDHDWVRYGLTAAGPPPHHRWVKAPALPASADQATATWTAEWATARPDFLQALRAGDVDNAWSLLSSTAERALGSATCSRSSPPSLQRATQPGHSKTVRCQTLPERQLRRLARRAQAFQTSAGLEALHIRRHLENGRADLATHFPSLSTLASSAPDTPAHISGLADKVAASAARARLHAWEVSVQENYTKLSTWVKGSAPSSLPTPAQPPADVAAHWASVWSTRWEAGRVDLPEVRRLTALLPTIPFGALDFTADSLARAARKTARTSPGLDQWHASDWERLAPSFYEALRLLWLQCLAAGRLPSSWLHIRIALVPKPDSSMRPIAVAVMAYRACMTATAVALRPWALAWAPPSLHGGLPGRSPDQLHEALFGDLEQAKLGPRHLCGTKADVRRCFDSLDYTVVFHISSTSALPRSSSHSFVSSTPRSFDGSPAKARCTPPQSARPAASCRAAPYHPSFVTLSWRFGSPPCAPTTPPSGAPSTLMTAHCGLRRSPHPPSSSRPPAAAAPTTPPSASSSTRTSSPASRCHHSSGGRSGLTPPC